ncbi:unnamed protein product [Prorocentrum cordatum]|uniref:Protein kinase domain-containing protein n=1 Tax=Prorocentrum cordatum TaxID=2364126 RepID=A0ABN9WLD4_9DINO|nr:unnamed protein product [Polarella glacialis]
MQRLGATPETSPRSLGDHSAGDRSLGEVCGGRFSLVSEMPRKRHHSTTLYQGISTSTEELAASGAEFARRVDARSAALLLMRLTCQVGRVLLQVAVKMERPKPGGLQDEVDILLQLARPGPLQGFLAVRFWGLEGVRNCLVTEFLGQSLANRVQERGRLSAQDTLLVAQQVLQRVEMGWWFCTRTALSTGTSPRATSSLG